jgi:signal transduction histidine kinase/CheY-like chemotaxis protein
MTLRPLHSIRSMMPVLLTVAALPSLLVLLYSGFEARNRALRDARQDTLRLAQGLAASQERITASTEVMLKTLSRVPSVSHLDHQACDELFRDIITLNPIYTNVLMTDATGNVIASAVEHARVNLADRKHFKDACRTRAFSTGEYIISRTTAEPAFPFSYPLLDEAGQVKAVLIASVKLKHYGEIFADQSLPDGSFFGITDHAGRRLFRIPAGIESFDIGKPVSAPVWGFVRKGGATGVDSLESTDGVRRITAFSRLDMGPDTPAYMYMFVGVPERTLARNASAVVFKNAGLIGISWLLAIVLSWMIGRFVFLKNLNRLTDAAERIGAGQFDITTGVDHAAGELGQMARTLDQMAGRLRKADEERDRLHAQLTQAQQLESVGQLAGGVAHDFNNMLTVILGRTEMLIEEVRPDDPRREPLAEIHEAAGRSANLTRQLLAFARKQTIAPVVLEVNDTIAGMLKMLQRLIGENIRVVWMPGMAVWPIKIDPAQVDQLLANLAVNARDAIAGPGTITIATENVVLSAEDCAKHADCVPGDYVRLSVSDDGCGMDQDTLSRVFEPFFTTKAVGKGTGLGLSTVYGVVKQNQGLIHVTSEPGRGTTFTICFPRHQGETSAVIETPAEDIPSGRGELVLLVEDERAILRLGQALLERLGYRVLAAATPAEAMGLMISTGTPIDLLITDVVMPGMNGRQLAERVRTAHPQMRCLYMSGYTANVIAHQGVLEQGVQFIEKPFSVDALAAKVRQVLDAAPHC